MPIIWCLINIRQKVSNSLTSSITRDERGDGCGYCSTKMHECANSKGSTHTCMLCHLIRFLFFSSRLVLAWENTVRISEMICVLRQVYHDSPCGLQKFLSNPHLLHFSALADRLCLHSSKSILLVSEGCIAQTVSGRLWKGRQANLKAGGLWLSTMFHVGISLIALALKSAYA